MINKIVVVLLLVFLGIYGTFWTFNHIDTWAGIGLGVILLTISANQINKKLK